MFFENRKDAGERMLSLLEEYRGAADTLVVGLPRGGIVVALEIAVALNLPLDVWVTRKIGAPLNPELAVGSVDSDGNLTLDDNAIRMYEISDRYIRQELESQQAEVKRRYQSYRGAEQAPDVSGKTVIVVDDGVATGFTMVAALQSIKNNNAAKIVCAIPVASPRIMRKLGDLADEVHCISTPSYFGAVGEFYRNFDQVSDDEVMICLRTAKENLSGPA
ncbi:MAG: phosphoribosyltransferase [Thermoleophilia bacterium]